MKRRLRLELAFTEPEYAAVLKRADERLAGGDAIRQRGGLLIHVLLFTGLRISEAARIRWEDFDFGRQMLQAWRHKKHGAGYLKGVTHSGAIREWMVIPEHLALLLQSLGLAEKGPLFIQAHGKAARLKTLCKDWYDVLNEAGVKKRGPHAARHTFATMLARETGNPYVVMEALGHKSIELSAVYVDRNPALLRERMNKIFTSSNACRISLTPDR